MCRRRIWLLMGYTHILMRKSTTPVNYYEKKRLVGLYGDISLGYKDMLFVNVTGRNDWSSTLPINNRSYFYPSISGSLFYGVDGKQRYSEFW